MSNGLSLTYQPVRLNLKHAWTIARGTSEYKDNIIVQVERDGIIGYGEVAPNVRYGESPESTMAVLEKAVPLFADSDPRQFVDLGSAIQDLDSGQTAAKAALDIALMDWVTKSLGVPMYRYLGLDKAKAPATSFSIGIDTPEIIQQKVLEAEEYPLLKVKLGGDRDEEIINTIRSVTDKPLFSAIRQCRGYPSASAASVLAPRARSASQSSSRPWAKPAQTTTRSGVTATPRARARYPASASRSCGRPRGSV